MKCVDLNSDLGESYGVYKIGCDSEILEYVTSANIACGWHGGDPKVMENTVKIAVDKGTAVGAHPSYPDLLGFGRRSMKLDPDEVKAYVKYQIGALMAFTQSRGVKIAHVKAHGALYNDAAKEYKTALAIAEAIYEVDKNMAYMGLNGSVMMKAGADVGLKVISEVFADREYMDDGSLMPRSEPGAVIHDEKKCISRVIKMVNEGVVVAASGKEILVKADSICVHGDNPSALNFVKNIVESLKEAGVTVKPVY
jgi:UPF0271 protein